MQVNRLENLLNLLKKLAKITDTIERRGRKSIRLELVPWKANPA